MTGITISNRTNIATIAKHYVDLAENPDKIVEYSDKAIEVLTSADTVKKVQAHLTTGVRGARKDAGKIRKALDTYGAISKRVGLESVERKAGILSAVRDAFTGSTRAHVEAAYKAGLVGTGKTFANAQALADVLGVTKHRVNQCKPASMVDKGGKSSKGGRKVNPTARVEDAVKVGKRAPEVALMAAVAGVEAALSEEAGLTITDENREEMRRLSAALTLHAEAFARLVGTTASKSKAPAKTGS